MGDAEMIASHLLESSATDSCGEPHETRIHGATGSAHDSEVRSDIASSPHGCLPVAGFST